MHGTNSASDTGEPLSPGRQALLDSILHAAHLLPAQGPIGVFIHHNTLHAFEELGFEAAVRKGAEVFGCAPYLSEDRYRDELARGRIRFDELSQVLVNDLGAAASEPVPGGSTRFEVRLAMLEHPLRAGQHHELDWHMAETDALRVARPDVSEVQRRRLVTETRHWVMRTWRGDGVRDLRPEWLARLFREFREQRIEEWSGSTWESFALSMLWEICLAGVIRSPRHDPPPRPPVRLRDLLLAAGAADSDRLVHEVLIRISAAFLDQGTGHWSLPGRDDGMFAAFLRLFGQKSALIEWWQQGMPGELARMEREGLSALDSVADSLARLGIGEAERDGFLSATLLALRGWGGMLRHVEERADRVHHGVPDGSLVEFLAVRLLLERWALRAVAEEAGLDGSDLADLRRDLTGRFRRADTVDERHEAYPVFQLAQILGWTPGQLFRLGPEDWARLHDEIAGFDELERRRLFHLAYELRFRTQTLDALARHERTWPDPSRRPGFQAVFCIDEREESIRRHVEELAPEAETFGVAGFFAVVMYYRGAAAADFVPLCPVVVVPQHWVSETVDESQRGDEARRRGARRRVGMALQAFHGGSRRVVSGAVVATSVGLLATVPLVARVLFPRLTSRLRGFFGRFIAPPPRTRLLLERTTDQPSPAEADHGYSLAEMINIAERLLRDMGLTQQFARLVFFLGHGSTSLNNPHESAHDCGACGGGVGGPNARAAASILNDARIRAGLRERGITIPDDTFFVGGLHNTSTDVVSHADLERVPASHRAELERCRGLLREASIRNAHERARRFESAPLSLSPAAAKRHMEGRAEDLSQVRPEWGHATNAICVVGRRGLTRGLFLDRRAFLVSYDPHQDDADASILARILGAVVPVCSGINLEYYFCYVDSPGWGSGSKLPHNLTGLLGVMDGAQSDLRTGLPWQMVEIHEPVRLLFVIESTPEALLAIMDRNPAVKIAVTGKWVQLAVLDPADQRLRLFQDGGFVDYQAQSAGLPVASSSRNWYAGWREPLEFARIGEPGANGEGRQAGSLSHGRDGGERQAGSLSHGRGTR